METFKCTGKLQNRAILRLTNRLLEMLFGKPSDFSNKDYRSRNYKGNWTKHFINNYVDSITSIGKECTLETFSNYKYEHLPKYLYKFMPPTIYSLNNIIQGTVYLSSPQKFNDPFDSYLCANSECFIREYILCEFIKKGYVKNVEESKEFITNSEFWTINNSQCDGENKHYGKKSFSTTFYEITYSKSESFGRVCREIHYEAQKTLNYRMKLLRNDMFKISCFSNFKDEDELMQNTMMWSHYADEHRGYCVKYYLNFNESIFRNILLCGLFPIKYTSRTEIITAKQLLNLKEMNGELSINDNLKKKIIKSLLNKSRFWNYEKEWRLIFSEKECNLLYENNIPFLKIDSIYLGCRIDKSIEQLIIKLGEKLDFNVFKTRQSDKKYILDYSQFDIKRQTEDEYFCKLSKIGNIEVPSERYRMEEIINMLRI